MIFRSEYEQDDEAWDITVKSAFTYGEAEDQDGTAFVNKRSWSTDKANNDGRLYVSFLAAW